MDTLTREQRSKQMAKVRSRDTKPEMFVRRLVHRLGYRYSLHKKNLPGNPDMVFVSRGRALFVNGCFWHGHICPLGRMPKSRVDYWSNKIASNRARDKANLKKLHALGWKTLVIWECQLNDVKLLERRLKRFLEVTMKSKSKLQFLNPSAAAHLNKPSS
ncbi:MAG: very short patch repair endonuclease [Nitrospiraceae bacterium]|nr:very short patch repair endonuclease [Nitrospiraceae bacterium]